MPNTKGKGKGQGPTKAKAKAVSKAKAKALRKAKAKALRKANAKALSKAKAKALNMAKAKALTKAMAKPLHKAQAKALHKPKTRPGPLLNPSPTWTTTSTRTQQSDSPPVGPIAMHALVQIVHECAAARKWAWEQGAARWLWFEKAQRQKEDKNGNMVPITEWVAQIEVSGNYDVTDGDLIHGWDMKRSDLDGDIAPFPDFIGKVHGDGTYGDMVTIVCANQPPIVQNHKYWCCDHPMRQGSGRCVRRYGRGRHGTRCLMPLGKNHNWLPVSLPRTRRSYATLWRIIT